MKAAIAIFAFAALGGLGLVFLRLSGGENPPDWMVGIHGLIAATAVVTLIVVAVRNGLPTLAKVALGVFVLAAVGGIFLHWGYHEAGLLIPIPLMLLHGGLAVTAFGLLVAALLTQTTSAENRAPIRKR